ncbi:MAG: acyltransferase [Devosia sp.]
MADMLPFASILCGYVAAALLATLLARGRLFRPGDPNKRIGTIDGLRGYLALGVVFHHYTLWQEVNHGRAWDGLASNPLNNLGQSSVALFFLVTGVLFYRIVGRKGPATNWVSLYVSRIFRLTPMLWLVTVIVAVFIVAHAGRPSLHDLAPIARWLTFLGNPDFFGYHEARLVNAGVLWTLKYEIAFYIGLPLVALLTAWVRRRALRLVVLGAITAVLFAVYDATAFEFQAGLLAFFPLGMIASELAKIAPSALRSRGAAAVGLAALVTQMFAFHGAYAPLPALLLTIAFIPVVAGNSYFGLLTLRGSVVLGETSYSIYMLHGIVLSVLMGDLVPRLGINPDALWLALPAVALGVVALSAVTFVCVERPFIGLGHRLGKRLSRPAPIAVPAAAPSR